MALAATWDAWALARLPLLLSQTRSAVRPTSTLPTMGGFVLLPFMHLAYLHTTDDGARWGLLARLLQELPCGVWGAAFLALLGRGASPPGSMPRKALGLSVGLWAAAGTACALWRGRFLSYPFVFWAGVGHRTHYELERWKQWKNWSWYFESRLELFTDAAGYIAGGSWLGKLVSASAVPSSEAAPASDYAQMANDCCWTCGREVLERWPPTHLPEERALLNCPGPIAGAKDRFGKSTCWTCWPLASADALREGKLLAQQILSGNNYSSNNSSDDNGTSNGSSTKNVNGSSSSSSGNVSSNGHASLPPAKATAEATATAEEAVEAATIAEAVAMSIAEATAMATAEAMNNFHTDGQHPLQLMAMAATTELPDEHDQNSNNNNNDNNDNNSNTDNSQQIAPTAREAAAASNGDTDQPSGDRWSESEWKEWRRRYDSYWWTNTTQDTVSVELPAELTVGSSPSSSSTAPVAEEVISDPRLQRLCSCIQQVTGTPVAPRPNAPLHGLDSLTVALLTARLRVEFGTAGLAIARVRQAATPAELLEAVEASASALPQESAASAGNGSGQEFAVWFSPGQATPMGGWVLRNDTDMDVDRFKAAALHLVERQWSLRAQPSDPLRLLSFCLDTSVFFTLAARWMDRGSWPLRRLRLLLSWAIRSAWPKVAVRSREAVYAQKGGTPLEVVTLHDQTRAEREIRRRRNLLTQSYEPVDIALIRIEARLEGLWVFGNRGGTGDFVIFKDERLGAAGTGKLVLADRNRNEAAVLLGPADAGWLPPPYGFPALLSARIRPGTGIVWLRLRGERQISLLWKADDAPETKSRQYDAFRMPGAGGPEALSVFSFLVVHAMHNIADGLSYEAIVGDLLALYASSDPRGGSPALPPLTVNSLDLLQQRFFSAINAADPIASPQLTSLRGSQWKCQKRGYGHLIGLQRNTVAALRWAAAAYSCPFDALLLALTVIATARSAGLEEVEFTLYVPLRDGPGEASLSGLFADWRVLTVRTDVSTSTVLGVVLDVAHKLRNRQWGIYNALKKPEASMVNFQLLDAAPPSSRAGFVQIGEELWRIGENQRAETRTNEQMPWSQQPLSFVVEEGDKETWWLLISCAYDDYPPPRLRRMVQAVQDAVLALVQQPTQLVHTPYPATFY
ncbi:unnamed protein product [Polarella glacialis]|uniref:Uncharacterized protein n=1 Tax=Polarella glacialis TaxID=89957 RepID=A0A813IJ67_POLGL|nr:unnamed protein product [Polarella glacialis]